MDALDLVAKLKMDIAEYEEGLDKATSKAKKSGGSISSAFGKIATTGVKAFVGAVTAAGTAVGALVKKSVDAYGEYEQLVGGVKTLFTPQESMGEFIQQLEEVGVSAEEAARRYNAGTNAVMENANKAWRTAGLSANEYMDEAISMSASLIQGLGGDTEAAAKIADMAITDMSDNVNKMGTTMEQAQNAYRGLSMGNFMMLDNLKLGYKGTAAEMARLINDSKIMGDEFVATADNVKDISYDKYIEAIHAVQEQMGITGTTAEEAATTIQGSVRMAQSAWTNLVTAMGDKDADLSSYISDFVTSVSTVASTVMPVAKQALEGVGQLVKELGPVIADAIPPLITDTIPSLLEAGVSMIQAILDGIQQNLPAIASGAVKIATMLITSLVGMLPQLLEVGLQLIIELANGISQALPQLIPTIVEVALQIVKTLIDNLPLLLDAAFTLVTALAEGIIENIDVIIEAIPELVQALVDSLVKFLPQMVEAWIKLMDCLEIALPEIIDAILASLPKLMDTLVNYWLGD